MHGALHARVRDHAEQAGPEAPVEGGQRLVTVDGARALHHAVVGAAVLQVQPHLQDLYSGGIKCYKTHHSPKRKPAPWPIPAAAINSIKPISELSETWRLQMIQLV